MNTSRTARSAAAFALSAAFTLAMLAGVGALFGGEPAAAPELARASSGPTQVVVIEGKRIARS